MEALKLFKAEMAKLFTNKGVLLSVIAVLLIPIVYAAVMLSATWGPYDNLSNLPVAVVNKDTGAMSGDEPINVGKDLVEEFKASKSLGWKFVSEEDAKKGLKNLDYYMVIEIPEDFSKNVTTVLDPDPKQLELKYIQNEGLNFMAAQVTNSATERIRESLGNKITQTYVENIFAQLGDVADGFKSAADGSDQIHSGTSELKDGTGQLLSALTEKSGDIDKLASGAKQLEAGTGELLTSLTSKQGDITKLANGAKDLNVGTNELLQNLRGKSGDISQLAAGAKELNGGTGLLLKTLKEKAPGVKSLADGAKGIEGGASSLSKGTENLLAGLESAQAGFNGAMTQLEPGSKELAGGMTQLSNGADELSVGAKELAAGIKQLAAHPLLAADPNVQKLVTGSQTLSDKLAYFAGSTNTLETGAAKIAGGIDQLNGTLAKGLGDLVAGQKEINVGAKTLSAGSTQLAAGASDIQTGWNTLITNVEKLNSGAGQISAGNATVETGWKALTSGATQLNSGASQISAGNQTVNQGWKQLSAGASKLNTGMKQVSDGTGSVQTGWGTLTEGVTKVDDGVGKLNAGSEELAEGLKGGAEQTNSLKVTDKNIAMFASPVNTVQEKVNDYQYYRDSTAPYILSLGLFVGILIMSFVVDFRKPAEVTASGVSWFIGKFLHLSVLAIIQAVVVSIFALVFLKLQVGNSFAFILFACVVSLAFLAIIFFLVSVAGNIGRFIAFIFIVLQLSTTGSNLPVEMLPEGLQSLSKFLPLTYTNAGFKAVISLDHMGSVWANTMIVLLILAVFAVLAFIISAIRKGQPANYDAAR